VRLQLSPPTGGDVTHITTTGFITLPDAESAKAWLISASG
jgi:hypothetical protein